jgi:protein SCO1/2
MVSLPIDQGAPPAPRTERRFARLVGSPLFWLFFVALGIAVPVLGRVLRHAEPRLPVLGTLPAVSLKDAEGRAFGSQELAGKVWMAGFIFTRCPTICPAVTATMGRVQHRARGLAPQFQLVSFSVDPQYDTPERLAEYARTHKASPRLWHFLTGPLDAVKQTVIDGLKIAREAPQGEQDFASVMHGTHFVLVDQQGRIRGYYASTDADVVDRVLHDASLLINRGE